MLGFNGRLPACLPFFAITWFCWYSRIWLWITACESLTDGKSANSSYALVGYLFGLTELAALSPPWLRNSCFAMFRLAAIYLFLSNSSLNLLLFAMDLCCTTFLRTEMPDGVFVLVSPPNVMTLPSGLYSACCLLLS